MTITQHSLLSAVPSAAIVATGGGGESALAFFAMGVFIDFDHFPDYWRDTGFNLKLKPFMVFFSLKKASKLWLPLHAWEWVSIGYVLSLANPAPAWVVWGLAGWSFHLFLDQVSNGLHPLGYFFFYRAWKGFDGQVLTGQPVKP